jgi:hypothetical protein
LFDFSSPVPIPARKAHGLGSSRLFCFYFKDEFDSLKVPASRCQEVFAHERVAACHIAPKRIDELLLHW